MILLFIINILFCIGLYACGTQGKIFYKQATWLAEKIGELSNPIINCLTCMSSLWGIVFYMTYYFMFTYPYQLNTNIHYLYLIAYILSLTGVNYIMSLVITLITSQIQLIKRKTELLSLDIQLKKQNGKS